MTTSPRATTRSLTSISTGSPGEPAKFNHRSGAKFRQRPNRQLRAAEPHDDRQVDAEDDADTACRVVCRRGR
jgi:hypothetical protein